MWKLKRLLGCLLILAGVGFVSSNAFAADHLVRCVPVKIFAPKGVPLVKTQLNAVPTRVVYPEHDVLALTAGCWNSGRVTENTYTTFGFPYVTQDPLKYEIEVILCTSAGKAYLYKKTIAPKEALEIPSSKLRRLSSGDRRVKKYCPW